jgi:hypothetical protein
MDLSSYEGESGSFEPVIKQTSVKTKDAGIETEEVELWERGTSMASTKNKKLQTKEVSTKKSDPSDLSAFLESVLPRMLNYLGKTTDAFQCKI